MTKIRLCEADLRKDILAKVKPRFIEIADAISFAYAFECDAELAEQIEDDDKLAGKIYTATSARLEKLRAEAVRIVDEAETFAEKNKTDPKAVDAFVNKAEDKLLAEMQAAADDMQDFVEKAIAAWQKVRNDRKKYKIKAAVNLTLGAVGIVTGSVSVAGAVATGGVSLVLGVVGLAKSVISLSKQVYSLAIDIDKAEKNLSETIVAVLKEYEKKSKTEVGARETGKALVEKITALIEPASIGKAEKQFSLFQGKLDGIDVKTTDYAKALHKLADAQIPIQKQIFDKLEKEAKGGYKSKRLPKLQKQWDELAEKTDAQIKKLELLYKKIDQGRAKEKIYEKFVNDLSDLKPGWVAHAEKAMAFIDIAVGLGAEGLPQEAQEILTLCADIGSELAAMAAD